MDKCRLAPLRNVDVNERPWEGECSKKPWEYKVMAAIPVLDTVESLSICVELLRLQTERPFICVIDTGSTDENLSAIQSLRGEDLEVHSLRLNGVQHPSDFPAMAMDLAQTLCRSPYLFATHADVFLRRRDFIKWLVDQCGDYNLNSKLAPVVGYEISPRNHEDWHGMISHTASMYYMPIMDQIGFGWSMRRLATMYNLPDHKPHPMRPNWPDTEILGNVILRSYEIPTKIIGHEKNFSRNQDENIDHCRSITSGLLYSQEYYAKAVGWYNEAKKEALERIEQWRLHSLPQV